VMAVTQHNAQQLTKVARKNHCFNDLRSIRCNDMVPF
jgi:hypothetical protein